MHCLKLITFGWNTERTRSRNPNRISQSYFGQLALSHHLNWFMLENLRTETLLILDSAMPFKVVYFIVERIEIAK